MFLFSTDAHQTSSTYQTIVKCEDAHVSTMVNVVPPHYGVGMILDPNPGQSIAADFIILILSLCTQ